MALETCQSDGVSDEVPSKDISSDVSKQKRFNLSSTSKFPGARYVVGQSGKQVITRKILGYGTKYGIGVFCFLETENNISVGFLKMTKTL